MLGLRDLVLIASSPSLHRHQQQQNQNPMITIQTTLYLLHQVHFSSLTAAPCMPQQQPQNNNVQENPNENNNFWNLRMSHEALNLAKKRVIDVDDENHNH
jgi:hypothetical protein